MFRVMGSMMPYRNKAYDIYRRNFSEASAVGFLSAILFTVFNEPVKNWVDFGQKWMELTGIPYQMNIAMLGFIVGYGTTKIFLLMRMQLFRMLLAYQGWMFNPKSTTTKMWALMLGLLRGNGMYPCFYFEPLLPRLPIPQLNKTLDRCLASMKPILSDEEFIELLTALESFRVKEGPQLQNYLVQGSLNKRNWLADYWLKLAYLSWREPIAVSVNCYAIDRKVQPTTDQLARAANLMYNVVTYYEQICENTLVPQYMQDLIPITMEGYKKMNCTVREPRLGCDEVVTYKDIKHIVIQRKGNFFKLDMYKVDSNGKVVQRTIPELYALLHQIIELADDSKDFCPVAVFTSQNRDYWAKVKERLRASDLNRESLLAIDSSIAYFSLEEESPKSMDEEGKFNMTGNGTNRYFDKALQYLVYANGKIGVNAEHAAGDATLPGRIWEYCLSMERCEDYTIPKVSDTQLRKLSPPEKLDWDLAAFETEISESLEHFKKLANSFDLHMFVPDYGKGWIKKKRLSPDGFLQMSIQLAYYRLTGKCVKTYESASTRMFAESRTETIRPVTDSSVAWCKAMASMKGTTRDTKILLLKRAINAQTKLKNEAVCAKGWDRHLFGLYACCREMGMAMPALFQNKNLFAPDVLSTSQTPTKFTDMWKLESSCLGGGFGTVHPDGYGISYIIVGEDTFVFHVSSNKYSPATSSQKMSDAIHDALMEMKALLD